MVGGGLRRSLTKSVMTYLPIYLGAQVPIDLPRYYLKTDRVHFKENNCCKTRQRKSSAELGVIKQVIAVVKIVNYF